jgi:ribosome biogenesis GTPase / thiamine phosphate phosphatase
LDTGTIIKSISGIYEVKTGKGIYKCTPRGLFRLKEISLLVGDKVDIDSIDENEKEAQIVKIYPRKNEMLRPRAANADQACIVISSDKPRPDFMLVDKMIVLARAMDLDVVLCKNKIDLKNIKRIEEELVEYEKAGFEIIEVSALTKDNLGELEMILKDKLTVLAGLSGVGKTSLINAISQKSDRKTGELSSKNERGKHTTRHVELIELGSGGFIIDTPGFSNLDMTSIEKEELPMLYPEFLRFFEGCRFKGCLHLNEPGCKIKEAVKNGEIGSGRYERYVLFQDQIKDKEEQKYR